MNERARKNLEQYMEEVKRIKRLTPDREAEYINTIVKSNLKHYLKNVTLIEQLTAEEKEECNNAIKALNAIVTSNLKLCVKIAKTLNLTSHNTYTIDDLIQIGNEALYWAAVNYNPDNDKKAKFSTYATRCIKLKLAKSLSEGTGDIHIPEKVRRDIALYYNTVESFGYSPTFCEVQKKSGLTKERLRNARFLSSVRFATHLDSTVKDKDGKDRPLWEVCGGYTVNFEGKIFRGELYREIFRILKQSLAIKKNPDKSAALMTMVLMLKIEQGKSYEEIGNELGFNERRARTLYDNTVKALRTPEFHEFITR